MKMSEIPVNQYTASELVRLCLRKHDADDANSFTGSVDSNGGEEDLDLVSNLQTTMLLLLCIFNMKNCWIKLES
jgi:hypothetical protein